MPNNVFSTALARNPYPFDSRSSRVRSHWLRAGIAKPLIVALCLIGVPGCSTWSVGPDFERPDMQNMPEKWDAGDPQHPLVGNVSLDTWWQSFNDPALNQLVTRARLSSPTIEAALLKIVQYRAQYAIAIGSFFPQTQELTGTYSSEHPSRRSADAPQPGEPSQPGTIQQLNLGFQATWEIDIWGKYRRNAEAAKAALQGAHAGYELALVTLSADVAQQYFSYRMTEKQLEIARRNSLAQKESVRLTEAMFRLGASSGRDYDQAVAMQKNTEADIPQLEAQLITNRNALCVLLGIPPGPIPELAPGWVPQPPQTASGAALASSVSTAGKTLPQGATPYAAERTAQSFIPLDIAIGVPADLLRRRPDVRQAEQEAAAQCARIGINKAALFPSFSISGFLGFQGSDVGAFTLGDTFSHNAFTASASPSLVLPFLNYGRLYNAVRAQDAVFQQSLVTYKQTVLQALQEAENAMSSFIRSRQRLTLLQQAAEAAGRSTKLALEQYNAGSTDFTTVVSAHAIPARKQRCGGSGKHGAASRGPVPGPGRRLAAPAPPVAQGHHRRDEKAYRLGRHVARYGKRPRCRAVRDPTSRNAQRLLICTAATPKHPFAKIPPACPRSSFPDCRGSLWPSALFWPAATTRRIRRKRMNPCPWPPSNRSGGTCLCWWKARG